MLLKFQKDNYSCHVICHASVLLQNPLPFFKYFVANDHGHFTTLNVNFLQNALAAFFDPFVHVQTELDKPEKENVSVSQLVKYLALHIPRQTSWLRVLSFPFRVY